MKPGRPIDPSLLALNEDGETVGFCCESCLNRFKASMARRPSSTSSASSEEVAKNFVRDRNSVRASEVGSPAPVGHLIREFGGSDREQIENSHKQASVTQVLNMLNGFVENRLLKNKDALVTKKIKGSGSMEDQIETAFMTILNRKPDSKEMRVVKDAVRKSGDDMYKDLVWVLINSHEFLFVQ